MPPRRRVTQAVVAAAILLAGGFLALKWRDSQTFFEPAVLLSRFPVEEAAVLSADAALLRKGGFLAAATSAPEPEYKQFVEDTGFDYRRDLDLVAASFSATGTYIIARGRFDFPKLEAYAKRQGGNCYQRLCRMQGSKPERRISFLPLREDTLALAVSTDDLAAAKMETPGPKVTAKLPTDPVWLSVPGAFLRHRDVLPEALRVTLSGMINADRIVLTIGAAGQGIELRMQAQCRSAEDARVLASQLSNNTTLLKEWIAKGAAAQDDLALALAGGRFDQVEKTVNGRWPVSRALLDSLTSGI